MRCTLVHDIDLLLTMDPEAGEGRLGALRDAAIRFEGDRVAWIGPTAAAERGADEVVSGRGCVALPGLVDCHTHAVWAGSRADEFERRLAGEDYTAILKAGGGILSTVRATRAASEDELVALGAARLSRLAARGVTAVEVKSGYGLTPQGERKLLVAARRAAEAAGLRLSRTFLGAHTVPAEWRHDRAAYVAQVIEEQLPLCAPEADAIDVYVDDGAFTVAEGEAILRAGQRHGLAARIHAEQVAATGAARMAAGLGARSADHLERIDPAGIDALAAAGTVGVLLPGAMTYLRDPAPPVGALREAGVRLAVATDLNPGTSPVADPWVCATLAAVSMRLPVEDVLLGLTRHGAAAIGRDDLGVVQVGGPADLALVAPPPGEPASAAALVQTVGLTAVRGVWVGGARR
ncbi:MAG: imidazolonepropionase [Myxococcota bacterium]